MGNDPYSEGASGIGSVIRDYLQWTWPSSTHVAIVTYPAGGRRARIGAYLRALVSVAGLPRETTAVFHLSQRGSFLREGSLLLVARIKGARRTVMLHGSQFGDFAQEHPRLTSTILRAAPVIVVLHRRAQRIVKEMAPRAAVYVITNAMDVARSTPYMAGGDVLFAGAIGRRKGVDILVSAWSGLPMTTRLGRRLILAGPVVDEDVLDSLPEDVVHAGPLARAEVLGLLDRCALAVLPSRAEAFPMFLLEALAHGRPIVATDVGGVADLVGPAGLVAPPGDVEQLRFALQRMLEDSALRGACADAAKGHLEASFTPKIVADKLESAWSSLP
ncbi:MAG: glycosyltransferase family 4 protein [Actinomycetota bacterium]|nr:glycosyltransferase family 4 protein [Actinomycetota bacterium]